MLLCIKRSSLLTGCNIDAAGLLLFTADRHYNSKLRSFFHFHRLIQHDCINTGIIHRKLSLFSPHRRAALRICRIFHVLINLNRTVHIISIHAHGYSCHILAVFFSAFFRLKNSRCTHGSCIALTRCHAACAIIKIIVIVGVPSHIFICRNCTHFRRIIIGHIKISSVTRVRSPTVPDDPGAILLWFMRSKLFFGYRIIVPYDCYTMRKCIRKPCLIKIGIFSLSNGIAVIIHDDGAIFYHCPFDCLYITR